MRISRIYTSTTRARRARRTSSLIDASVHELFFDDVPQVSKLTYLYNPHRVSWHPWSPFAARRSTACNVVGDDHLTPAYQSSYLRRLYIGFWKRSVLRSGSWKRDHFLLKKRLKFALVGASCIRIGHTCQAYLVHICFTGTDIFRVATLNYKLISALLNLVGTFALLPP